MTRKGLDLHRVSQSDAQREGAALTEAIAETPFFSRFRDLDSFLAIAEAHYDRTTLRASILAEGDRPENQWYGIAFVRDAGPVGPGRVRFGDFLVAQEPHFILFVSTPATIYDMAVRAGDDWAKVFDYWSEAIYRATENPMPEQWMAAPAEQRVAALLEGMVSWIRGRLDEDRRDR